MSVAVMAGLVRVFPNDLEQADVAWKWCGFVSLHNMEHGP